MKKIFLMIAFTGFGLSGIAQVSRTDTGSVAQTDTSRLDMYCAHSRDGAIYLVRNGKEITSDVMLEDGTIIHPDGLVETSDRMITMRANQCIRRDGKFENEITPAVKGTAKK